MKIIAHLCNLGDTRTNPLDTIKKYINEPLIQGIHIDIRLSGDKILVLSTNSHVYYQNEKIHISECKFDKLVQSSFGYTIAPIEKIIKLISDERNDPEFVIICQLRLSSHDIRFWTQDSQHMIQQMNQIIPQIKCQILLTSEHFFIMRQITSCQKAFWLDQDYDPEKNSEFQECDIINRHIYTGPRKCNVSGCYGFGPQVISRKWKKLKWFITSSPFDAIKLLDKC